MTYQQWTHVKTQDEIKRMQKQPKHDFCATGTNGNNVSNDNAVINRGPHIPYAGSNNPRAGQWDGRVMSRHMVADYKRFGVVDGIGVRNSLYVSGCPFRCEGCFQPSIFDFHTGFEYTQELEDRIINDLDYSYVDGITFLGGEPMLNTPILIPLARRIRETYGDDKTIWCWTGYTWEELHRDGETPDKLELLSMVDVLVDGRFMQPLKDPMLQFRGSANQRIIDVHASTADNVHIWDSLHDEHLDYGEIGVDERNKHEGAES